jgi:SnoaL-like protein
VNKLPVLQRRSVMLAILAIVVGLALPLVQLHAQQSRQSATTIEALAAKVKHLEDVQDITNLLIAYGRALDSRDFKAYAALFAKDGSWSGGMGTVTGGPQAIYDFMTSRIGGGGRRNANGGNASAPIGWGPTYHIMSSPKIDVTGDTATASSRWAFVTAARGPGIQVAGRYEDTLVREDGAWKFKSRQAFNDLAAPAAPTGAGAQSRGGSAAPPAER